MGRVGVGKGFMDLGLGGKGLGLGWLRRVRRYILLRWFLIRLVNTLFIDLRSKSYKI